MADVVSPQKRSQMMAGIKGKNTKPEMMIRTALHRRGFRYRIHNKDLPGKPDLVFAKYRAVVFVHGCFWHAHECHLFKWPKSRAEFWREKIGGNRARDVVQLAALDKAGWRVLIIWECALKGKTRIDFDVVINQTSTWLTGADRLGVISGGSVDGD